MKEMMNKGAQKVEYLAEYPSINLQEVHVKHGNTL